MAAPELELVGALIEHGYIPKSLIARLSPVTFSYNPEAAIVYKALLEWAKTHDRNLPSLTWVQNNFPNIDIPQHVSRDLEELSEEVLRIILGHETQDAITDFVTATNHNSRKINKHFNTFYKRIGQLNKTTSDAITKDFSSVEDKTKQNYTLMENGRGYTDYPWPWDYLTESTGGIYKGAYYAIRGLPGNFKTWILCYIMATLLVNVKGIRLGLQSQEVADETMLSRITALILSLKWNDVRRGTLSQENKELYFGVMNDLRQSNNLIFIPRSISHDKLGNIADMENLDGMFLDAFYAIPNFKGVRSSNFKHVADISAAIQSFAPETDTFVFVTTQINPRQYKLMGGGNAAAAFSQSISYDADGVIEIVPNNTKEYRGLSIAKMRDDEVEPFTIYTKPAESFEFMEMGLPDENLTVDDSPKRKINNPFDGGFDR